MQQLKGNKLIIFGGGTFVGWLWANLFSFSDCLYLLQTIGMKKYVNRILAIRDRGFLVFDRQIYLHKVSKNLKNGLIMD